MFRKFHIRVAVFCTFMTSIIMISMSALYMIPSESNMRENEYAAFLNDVHMMVTTLENQLILSNEWIARMERGGMYIISILDNGNPILYEELVHSPRRQEVVEAARSMAIRDYGFSPEETLFLTRVTNFTLDISRGRQYYVSAVLIPREAGVLQVFIIYSLESLQRQIVNQRVTLLMLNLVGIGLLGVFSYFFTKKMLEPLKKSRKQQTEFIASASHELRTPLAVIQTSLSALEKADEEEASKFYNAIESECERMSSLISDLLALASTDNYTLSTEMKELELDTLLLDVAEKFEILAKEKEITISVDLPPHKVPPMKGDENRLTQVFAILLDNAVSYSPVGSEIGLSIEVLKSKIQVSVVDNGIGIPEEEKDKIWERFYRVDASRKSGKHFGLGLPIAKEIVHLHKGKISVKDNPKGGSTFVVTLPI